MENWLLGVFSEELSKVRASPAKPMHCRYIATTNRDTRVRRKYTCMAWLLFAVDGGDENESGIFDDPPRAEP